MHYLDESHIFIFLVQVLILLGLAKTLSVLCEAVKIPALTGEILAGIMLGPTLFGRVVPDAQLWLFPMDQIQWAMLDTVSWLGVFFLLLSSGFHINVNDAIRSGKAAFSIGIVGVLVPIALGYPIFRTLDSAYWGAKADGLSFSLFLAVACSITAISVVARALGDLKLNKTSESSLALSACAVNDLFGWILFTLLLSLISSHEVSTLELAGTVVGVVGFIFVSISFGPRLLKMVLNRIQATSLPQPTASMTVLVSTGLLCGAATQFLGIHAVLGFFLAGIIVGSTKGVSDKIQNSISNTLHAIFVPLFFATIGLKVDFLEGLKLWPTLLFTVVAILGKFGGAWLGAKLGKVSPSRSVLMGIIFIPGGAMEIVVATLALELQLIGQAIFVAIVFGALFSSILVAPLIGIQTRKMGINKEATAKAQG
jgi:Kef-type K+ transport system membrane component KefB